MEKEENLLFKLRLLARMWPLTLPPAIVFVVGCLLLWSAGVLFALGVSAFVAFLVFGFCVFVGMAVSD